MKRRPSLSTVRLYRTLFLIGAVSYWVFWFILKKVDPNSFDPISGRTVISLVVLLAFALSFYSDFFRNRIVVIGYCFAYLLSFYYIFLLVKNNYSNMYAIGMLTVLFGITVIFKESFGLLIYLVSCLAAVCAGYLFVEAPAEDPYLFMSILITISIVSFLTMSIRLNAQKALRLQHRTLEHAYEEINEQKKIVDLKNADITDSINYAKKIQQAIIPSEEELFIMLRESFIYYREKDIVSGDFYWMTEHENEKILAAVDCTGHGVPGSLVSMLGVTLLNQIVGYKKVTKPGRILNNLQREIYSFLQRGSNDGMDISICSVNMEKMQVSYAGAIMPLIMIRDGELKEIRGDRQSISRNTSEKLFFTDHTIDVKKGDMFYLFSDGYCDQFGGLKKKKFMVRRFKEMLLRIYTQSMEEQKNFIDRAHLEWRGALEQVDDILVIGFRI